MKDLINPNIMFDSSQPPDKIIERFEAIITAAGDKAEEYFDLRDVVYFPVGVGTRKVKVSDEESMMNVCCTVFVLHFFVICVR